MPNSRDRSGSNAEELSIWSKDARSPSVVTAGNFSSSIARSDPKEPLEMAVQPDDTGADRYRELIANSPDGIWRLDFTPAIDITLSTDSQIELAFQNGRLTE